MSLPMCIIGAPVVYTSFIHHYTCVPTCVPPLHLCTLAVSLILVSGGHNYCSTRYEFIIIIRLIVIIID